MGINKEGIKLLHLVFDKVDLNNVRMFEFGDQVAYGNGVFEGPAKYYLESLGIDHTSLDLCGLNESLKRDITESIEDLGQFDVVTNFGSSEHVEPFKKQYDTFKNLHNLCKNGGYIIHQIPPIGHWLEHGPIHYSDNFFKKLSWKNSYDVIYYEFIDSSNLISCVLMKTNDDDFMNSSEFPFDEMQWDGSAPYWKL
jgi:hypothetical protein